MPTSEVSRSPRTGLHAARVLDAAFFALYGCAFFAWWAWADPSREVSATQFEWPHVLAFSGVLLLLGFAVARHVRLVDGRRRPTLDRIP